MQMLNVFCHSSLVVMLYLYLSFFVVSLLFPSVSIILFSMGHVLHCTPYNVVFICMVAICLFPTSLLRSDPCFVFSYHLVITFASSYICVEFFVCKDDCFVWFLSLFFLIVVKYLVTISFYFMKIFFLVNVHHLLVWFQSLLLLLFLMYLPIDPVFSHLFLSHI